MTAAQRPWQRSRNHLLAEVAQFVAQAQVDALVPSPAWLRPPPLSSGQSTPKAMAPFPSRGPLLPTSSASYPPSPSRSPPLPPSPSTKRPSARSLDPIALFGDVGQPGPGVLGGLGRSWESKKVLRDCLRVSESVTLVCGGSIRWAPVRRTAKSRGEGAEGWERGRAGRRALVSCCWCSGRSNRGAERERCRQARGACWAHQSLARPLSV